MRINDWIRYPYKTTTSSSILQQDREIWASKKNICCVIYIYNVRHNAISAKAHAGCWKIKFKDARSHMRRRKKMRASQGKSSSFPHMLLHSARSSPEWNYSTCFETLNPLSVYLPTVVKRTSSDTRPSFIRTEN